MSHFLPVMGFPWRYLFLPCVLSAFRHLPLDKMCGNGKGCCEIAIIFQMESDHTEAFSSSYVCAQMRQVALSGLKWACHRGTDVERRRGVGTKEREE